MADKIILDKKIQLPENSLNSISHFNNNLSKNSHYKNNLNNTNTNDNINITNYDDECLNRYGNRTCLLIQLHNKNNMYQIRYMDKINYYKDNLNIDHVSKELFNELIPHLISYNYTVVVIENLNNTPEITAIHKPTGEFYSILNFY